MREFVVCKRIITLIHSIHRRSLVRIHSIAPGHSQCSIRAGSSNPAVDGSSFIMEGNRHAGCSIPLHHTLDITLDSGATDFKSKGTPLYINLRSEAGI